MELRIREAVPEEFDLLWSIDQRCFEPGIAYTRRELAYYMKQRGAFTLVGETRSAPRSQWRTAGFLVGRQLRDKVAHIITIDVLEKARRSGLGTRLMNWAEARLRDLGCETMVLETAVDNLAAIRFYKRLGYTVAKTLPRYYLGRIDAFLMVKPLKEEPPAE